MPFEVLLVEFPDSVVLSVAVSRVVGASVGVVGMAEELGGVMDGEAVDDSCWHLGNLSWRISLLAEFSHLLMNKVAVEYALSTYETVKNVDVTVRYTVLVALTKELHRFSNGRKKNNVGSGSTSIGDP